MYKSEAISKHLWTQASVQRSAIERKGRGVLVRKCARCKIKILLLFPFERTRWNQIWLQSLEITLVKRTKLSKKEIMYKIAVRLRRATIWDCWLLHDKQTEPPHQQRVSFPHLWCLLPYFPATVTRAAPQVGGRDARGDESMKLSCLSMIVVICRGWRWKWEEEAEEKVFVQISSGWQIGLDSNELNPK